MQLINLRFHKIEIMWVLIIDGDKRQIEEVIECECYRLYKTMPQIIRLEENIGLAAARNKACQSFNADYFGWIDADDSLILPEYIKFVTISLQMSADQHSTMIYFSDSYDCDENLNILNRREKSLLWSNHIKYKGTKNDSLAFVDFVYQCQLVRADVFATVGGFTENILGEDVDLLLKIIRLDEEPNIMYVPFAPYLYRLNKEGICENLWDELCASMENTFQRHANSWANEKLMFRYAGNYISTFTDKLMLSKQEKLSSLSTCLFDVYLPIDAKDFWPDFLEKK